MQALPGGDDPDLQGVAVVGARVLGHRGEGVAHRLRAGSMSSCSASMSASIREVRPRRHALGVAAAGPARAPRPRRRGGGAARRPSRPSGAAARPTPRCSATGVLLDRGHEAAEVAAEGVVHDVHAGLVVGTLGGVRLAGQGELLGPGGRVVPRCLSWRLSSPRWRVGHDLVRLLSRLGRDLSRRPRLRCCAVWVRVLGTSQVALADDPASRRRRRRPQAALGRWRRSRSGSAATCPPTRWCDLVWGEDPPPRRARHAALLRLRRTTRPRAGPRAPAEAAASLLDQRPRLPAALGRDRRRRPPLRRRGTHASTAHSRRSPAQFTTGPAPTGRPGGRSREPSTGSRSCSRLWSGEAYADLARPARRGRSSASSLDQFRRGAEEAACWACSRSGDHAVVVAATEQATAAVPAARTRLGAARARPDPLGSAGRGARPRCARSASVLADELGLDPGHELRDLEQAVLGQDPALHRWLRARRPLAARAGHPAGHRRDRYDGTGWPHGRPRGGRWPRCRTCSTARRRARPASALLVGEPGIGKSRLVQRLSRERRRPGFRVATRPLLAGRRGAPLWPWSRALGDLAGTTAAARRRGRAPAGRTHRRAPARAREREAFRARESMAHEVLSRSSSPGRSWSCSTTCTGPTPRP